MRIVFACAGTGGHINPAIAMANLMKKREPDTEVLFIGTEDGLENKLVKKSGYNIEHIRTGKILRSLTLKNITALIRAYQGIGDSRRILEKFKPDLVIGTGGYICGPVMMASKKKRIPYILHESNAFPGIAVKILAKNSKCVMLGFEETKSRLDKNTNAIYTGTPAKFSEEDILKLDKDKCMNELGINAGERKIILVTCGSQGAKRINEIIISMVKQYQDENCYFIVVTGDKNYDSVIEIKNNIEKELNKSLDKFLKIEKFVYDMDKMYCISDLCITRAGAMTISELALSGRPAVLIPLPTAAENHQYFNAKVLEDVDAAKIVEQRVLNEESLYDTIKSIIMDNDRLKIMGNNARKVIVRNVEDKIYNCIKMK